MSNIRAILFDLDETLTDRPNSIAKMCHLFLTRFSDRVAGLSLDELYRRIIDADRGGYRPKEEFFAELCQVLPWDEKPPVVQIAEFWRAEFPGCAVERCQATQTLRLLRERGFLLGLVTNGLTSMQNAKIDSLSLREYFSTIIISEVVGVKKPDPRIFIHALSSLKITPAETAFVGDHPLNDIVPAQSMGMKAVWLRGSHEWPLDQPLPQFYIDTLTAIPALLGQPCNDRDRSKN